MSLPNFVYKDPDETRSYGVDFSARLGSSETISSSNATSSVSGLTLSSTTDSDSVVSFRVSDGTHSVTYPITVTVETSAGNIYEECIFVTVSNCDVWKELLMTFRVMIGDLDFPPDYTDARLIIMLCVAAQYVQQDLDITTYTINVAKGTISPDPAATTTRDTLFMNLIALKAACLIDHGVLRAKAGLSGVRAMLGPLSLQTDNHLQGFIEVLKNGACKAYEDAVWHHSMHNRNIFHAVLSPFSHNDFDPSRDVIYSDRRGNS